LFTKDSLKAILGLGESETEDIALKWMVTAGKRWRPFLAVCAHYAVASKADGKLSDELGRIAVAVECFHKASLVHDDIEDGDDLRYGQKTVHAQFGVPCALNVGDFLLGEGYRLLAELDIDSGRKNKMLRAAALGHRELCLGQGKELAWIQSREPLIVAEVIDIFQKKTSPAFEVALKLGVLLSGNDTGLDDLLKEYSRALGVAYQIRDDIEDFDLTAGAKGGIENQPSLLFAIGWQRADEDERRVLESFWKDEKSCEQLRNRVSEIFTRLRVKAVAMEMLESYKRKAISCLEPLENAAFKALLRRVISKVFNEIDIMKCCRDYKEAGD